MTQQSVLIKEIWDKRNGSAYERQRYGKYANIRRS